MNGVAGQHIGRLGLAALLAACLQGAVAQDSSLVASDAPPVYEATYRAQALGMSATAYRTQTLVGDDTYRLENRLSLTFLGANVGTVAESSEFRWDDAQVLPLQYRYSQTGVSSREESVLFNWDGMSALSTRNGETWTLPLRAGVQDKLSYSQSLRQDIGVRGLTQITYAVADTDEIDEQLYEVSAEEVLQTPLGALNTVRIERVRSGDSRRRTTVWLALDWQFLLVRLEQVSGSGTQTSLSLESATVNGETLSGL